jgi:hypothetical protein
LVSWEPVQAATAYELWYGTSEDPAGSQKTREDIQTGDEAVIRGLRNDTPYYVRVRAKNRSGPGGFSPGQWETPVAASALPAAPVITGIMAGDGVLSLSWDEVPSAAAYEVWYGTSPDPAAAEKLQQDNTEPRAVIGGLKNGAPCYVRVRAKNHIGPGDFSREIAGMPREAREAPEAPRMAAIEPLDRALKISWCGTAGASSYLVYLGLLDHRGVADRVGEVRNQTTMTLTGLSNHTTYFVWVKAKNKIGESDFCAESLRGTPSPLTTIPAAPVILSVKPEKGGLSVTWQETEGAALYRIWMGTGPNSTHARKAAEVSGVSTVTLPGTRGTRYYLWISAKNRFGEGEWSAPATGTPK